jgi:hypothetical protein
MMTLSRKMELQDRCMQIMKNHEGEDGATVALAAVVLEVLNEVGPTEHAIAVDKMTQADREGQVRERMHEPKG